MKVFWICNYKLTFNYKGLKLIFLTYINRSGSTFLANLFSKSPDVLVCPEGEILMNELLVNPGQHSNMKKENRNKFIRHFKEDPKLKYWNLSEDIFENLPENANNFEIFILIITSYKNQIKPEASVILFKAERLIHLFDNLMEFVSFDETCFLSIIRDCRGVYASQKITIIPDSDKLMSRNPVQTAMNWKIHVNKALNMSQAGVLEVIRYEELILNTEEMFSRLLGKTGIPFFKDSGKKGDLFDRLPESHRIIHVNILKEPIFTKTDSWKETLSLNEQCIIKIITGENLSVFNQSFSKQVCPIFTWPLLGYYFMEYLFHKVARKIKFIGMIVLIINVSVS